MKETRAREKMMVRPMLLVVLDRLRVEYGEYRSIAVSSSALSSHDTEQRIIDMTHNFRTNKYIFINLFFYLDDCLNWENLKITI